MYWFYYVARVITRLLLWLLARYQVTGIENVPGEGPLLVAANHLSLADPPIVGISIGRRVTFMAKEDLFRARFSGYFMRHSGAFPVRRGGLDRQALKQAEQWLARGVAVVVFPEGKRSRNARLGAAFPGSALIASRTGAPILPVGISGTEGIKGLRWILKRPRIRVNIGRPFLPPGGNPGKAERAQLTDGIMRHIAALLPPQYRGIYADGSKDED